jgi:small acid-soluble spore protein H (minor)
MVILKKKRVEEILESKGVINVTYNNNPVWLVANSSDTDGAIQIKDIKSNKIMTVYIRDLEE